MSKYNYTAYSNDGTGRMLASALCESDFEFETVLRNGFSITEINCIESDNPASKYARPGIGVLFTKLRKNPEVRFYGFDMLLLGSGKVIQFERLGGQNTDLHLYLHGSRIKSFENAQQAYEYLHTLSGMKIFVYYSVDSGLTNMDEFILPSGFTLFHDARTGLFEDCCVNLVYQHLSNNGQKQVGKIKILNVELA